MGCTSAWRWVYVGQQVPVNPGGGAAAKSETLSGSWSSRVGRDPHLKRRYKKTLSAIELSVHEVDEEDPGRCSTLCPMP